jgi:xanthine dehydrogenase accessory factor
MASTVTVFEQAAELEAQGQPFVLVTVVWRRGPTSGRQGAKALILPDGSMRGWLGGACAEPAVMREALASLADGRPRLLLLGPLDELERGRREGVDTVPIACASEGALEVYVEPVLPAPQVVVIGRTPAVDLLASLVVALGWRASIVDDGGDLRAHAAAGVPVTTTLDLGAIGVDGRTAIVVATQGHYDELALQAALATDAGYVGLVASAPRAEAVLDYLRARGAADADLARVRAPAGLDLGRVAHHEIAVAILAELVALRAAGALAGRDGAAAPDEARDPVCGMVVNVATSRYQSERGGVTSYFCGPSCYQQFEAGATPSREQTSK